MNDDPKLPSSASRSVIFAWISIGLAIGCQLFNDLCCYEKTLLESLIWMWFTLIPVVPAAFFMFAKKPIAAIGAALVVIPFYAMAYYSDCILPYQGGGASMVYVIVIMFGTPVAIATGLLSHFLAAKFGEKTDLT